MQQSKTILTDSFGRTHNYLRISLTERCNLRCTYCMPANGISLSPKPQIMTAEEIYAIAKVFVKHGVTKIRLTGGEPLVRKDFTAVLERLSSLGIKLSITTNGVLVDRYMDAFKTHNLQDVNLSLDTLNLEKFNLITRRNAFKKTFQNFKQLLNQNFNLKINVVLIKGFNDDEIIDFVNLSKELPISIRFIEFMPFSGNDWDKSKLVSQQEILDLVNTSYDTHQLQALPNELNFTSRDYKVEGFAGSFGIISSVTNPFCDSCNRIRLTANGRVKNCLFSNNETDILSAYRNGDAIEALIQNIISNKLPKRAGMDDFEKLNNPSFHNNNRSMIAIGG